MVLFLWRFVASIGLLTPSSAFPAEKRSAPEGVATIQSALSGVLGGLAADASEASSIFSALIEAVEDTTADQIPGTPTSLPQVSSILASVFSAAPTVLYENLVDLAANGLSPGKANLENILLNNFAPQNSVVNINLRSPKTVVFPKKAKTDAPYTLSEAQLREVIYIPPTFTYGQKPPVILVPGTGNTGYQTFSNNFIPLLTGVSFADPVWLNIPNQLLMDAQVNAEYVAYAINYIAGITNKKVSLVTWSQGGLISQWAFKYWPSTRNVTSDLISISPDFHGTLTVAFSCPGTASNSCTPAIIQQGYTSNLITKLRSNGGDSAYVPTTTIYSGTDEIVNPQTGTGASAFINDARAVGVSNTQVQTACPGQPAGGTYTHEGVLYNPLSFALAVDALTHSGPGLLSRINLASVCAQVAAPGLTAQDLILTEG